jgi:cobalt-zinc-cadmium efflux system membrane fusion protein
MIRSLSFGLLAIALGLCLSGCSEPKAPPAAAADGAKAAATPSCVGEAGCVGKPAPPTQGPTVSGDRVVFPDPTHLPGAITVTPAPLWDHRILTLSGRLVWNEDVTVRISTPFNGRVIEIRVHAGTPVKAGETLAILASPDFGVAQADLRKDESDLELAKQNLYRSKELFEHGAAARKQMEEAQAAYGRAEAEFEASRKRLQLYGQDTDSIDQRYVVRSPLPGVVVERAINPGQELRADPGAAPLFVVSDPTTLWVELAAHEEDADQLHPGMAMTLVPRQAPEHKIEGVIDQISDFVDPATRTVKVRGKVANPDRKFKAEMFVTAEVPLPGRQEALVAAKAVFLVGDRNYLFVADGPGTFHRQEVRIGAEEAGQIPVLTGIAPGTEIVTEGVLFLQGILTGGKGDKIRGTKAPTP